MPAEFHCGCNRERATRVVLALGRAELEDMISKGRAADVYYHFCGEHLLQAGRAARPAA